MVPKSYLNIRAQNIWTKSNSGLPIDELNELDKIYVVY